MKRIASFIAFAIALLGATQVAHATIPQASIDRALTWLTPYNGGQRPCQGDTPATTLWIERTHFDDEDIAGYAPGYSLGFPPDCHIQLADYMFDYPDGDYDCAVIIHELGHEWFHWDHVNNRHNIMYPDTLEPPGECYASGSAQSSGPSPSPDVAPSQGRHHRRRRRPHAPPRVCQVQAGRGHRASHLCRAPGRRAVR